MAITIDQRLDKIERLLETLISLATVQKLTSDWIPVEAAMILVGLTNRNWFLQKLKAGEGHWSTIRHRKDGKTIQVSHKSIQKYLERTSA